MEDYKNQRGFDCDCGNGCGIAGLLQFNRLQLSRGLLTFSTFPMQPFHCRINSF